MADVIFPGEKAEIAAHVLNQPPQRYDIAPIIDEPPDRQYLRRDVSVNDLLGNERITEAAFFVLGCCATIWMRKAAAIRVLKRRPIAEL